MLWNPTQQPSCSFRTTTSELLKIPIARSVRRLILRHVRKAKELIKGFLQHHLCRISEDGENVDPIISFAINWLHKFEADIHVLCLKIGKPSSGCKTIVGSVLQTQSTMCPSSFRFFYRFSLQQMCLKLPSVTVSFTNKFC